MAVINFEWDLHPDTNVDGYKLHCGTTSGGPYDYTGSPKVVVGRTTLKEFFTVTPPGVFYFRLTATIGAQNSGFSAEEPLLTVILPISNMRMVA